MVLQTPRPSTAACQGSHLGPANRWDRSNKADGIWSRPQIPYRIAQLRSAGFSSCSVKERSGEAAKGALAVILAVRAPAATPRNDFPERSKRDRTPGHVHSGDDGLVRARQTTTRAPRPRRRSAGIPSRTRRSISARHLRCRGAQRCQPDRETHGAGAAIRHARNVRCHHERTGNSVKLPGKFGRPN